jgi:high-affinity nickel permease
METKKLIKLSSLVFLMIFVLILTVPLTTEIFGLMNTSNTVLNLIGVFIYLMLMLIVVIVEYHLYKDFKKILNRVTSPENKEEKTTTNK